MEPIKSYTIHFSYEITEDAIKFPLQADVTVMADNSYVIDNIRHSGKGSGALIPPVSLVKQKESWIYTHSKKETGLSLAIGRAIDSQERSSPPSKKM